MSINSVSGTIYNAFDDPMTAVTVEAFDKDLRNEQSVGHAITNAQGYYSIKYDGEKYTQAENQTSDIFIRVSNGGAAVLGTSAVNFNVPADFTLDFKIDGTPLRGISEFDALVNAITPLLQNQQVTMAELVENKKNKDITFLAAETGEAFDKIALLPIAFSYAATTRIAQDIFYGWFRLNFPTDLNELLLVKSESLLNGLKMAIGENIISCKWESQLESIIQEFNSLATNYILTGTDEKNIRFQKVLGSVLLDVGLQKTFIDTYFANEEAPEKFWEALSEQDGFANGNAIKEVQNVLLLYQFTGLQPELTSLLYTQQKANPELSDLRGFAAYTREDWKTNIAGLVLSGEMKNFPDGIEGATHEEKTENYADALNGLINALFPTDVFAKRMAQDSSNAFNGTKTDLNVFLLNNPGFDLKTNSIHTLFNGSNLDGVSNIDALKNELKSITLLYKLSPTFEHVSALKNLSLGSATDIVQKYSADQLAEKLVSANVTREEAQSIYDNALQVDKKSTAIAVAYKTRHDVPFYAINGNRPVPNDYESMFRDNYLCDCEECQSVYSPSAYFVDLLNFIQKNSASNDNASAFNRLISRRPDLTDILLTCQNTNTPLPYIDLVNELLESLVANQTTVAYQTNSTENELAAYPQNILAAADEKLTTSAADYCLPIDLPLKTSRKILEKFDLDRQVIMERFIANGLTTIYTDIEIAKEVLGLSSGDIGVLNGTIPITGITVEFTIQTILRETQLSYIDLLQVLESYFVNPPQADGTRSLQIVSTSADEPTTCDITKLILSGIDYAGLLKLLRFVRLQKKLNWSVFDLDGLLNAFSIVSFDISADEFNNKVLIPIANVVRLKKRFNISVQKALSIFSLIDTDDKPYKDHSQDNQPVIPSLYEQLFRNKAVSNPIDEGFTPKALGLSGPITAHIPVLLSALNISPADLTLLLAGNNGLLPAIDNLLTLPNLSELYRRASFATLLKLTISDFFDAVAISGISPFQGSTQTESTLTFIVTLDFIRTANINLKELNYVLANKESDPALFPSVEVIAEVLDAIRTGLKKISIETGSDDLTTDPAIRAVAEALIIDKLSSVFKTDHATTKVVLGETVKLDGSTSIFFLAALLVNSFFSSTVPLFTLDASKNANPSFPHIFNSYLHASKIVFLIKKFKLSAEELHFFTQNASSLSLDPLLNNQVPIAYAAFENLFAFVKLRNSWKLPSSNFLEVLSIIIKNEANAKSNFLLALSGTASGDATTLHYLLGDPADSADKGSLNLEFPNDYLKGKNLLQLFSCLALLQKTGVDAGKFLSAINTNDSSFLTGLLKSKYTEEEWLDVIQPISNELRILRRDALVAYLLKDPSLAAYRTDKFTDSNSLYEYLLIDVEMDACMFTSRIKQDISSVQLFIDRCLMNLEDGVLLSSDFVTQWNAWRKLYRVWEANRKIFLYPENWIEPELRDDKSPFFEELESKLRQNEVTDETAQDALLGYLEKLDAIANLEMVGVFPDELTGIVHVIGRTPALPHQYHYRNQKETIWSAWEKMDVDIEGDHILPVVWNNRLMLFWATFTEKQDNGNGAFKVPHADGEIPPAPKYLEMKLAWSEYKNGKWSSKKISKEFVTINNYTEEQISMSSLFFMENLLLRVFVPDSSNNDILKSDLGGFSFNDCNSSPSIIPAYEAPVSIQRRLGLPPIGTNFSPPFEVQENMGYDSYQMFLKENGIVPFTVYDAGLYKALYNGNNTTFNLFGNTPGNVQLLPNHHQIEQEKPAIFFYSNEYNNFYVHSIEVYKPPRFDDVLTSNTGILIQRNEIEPQNRSISPIFNSTGNGTSSAHLSPAITSATSLLNGNIAPSSFKSFFRKRYLFQTFYHPYVCSFIKTLNSEGIDGLYVPEVQQVSKEVFTTTDYNPTPAVWQPYPMEKVDFDFSGAYSIYNWELFFHIPLLIATRLSQNQKFEEARKWFHYIFNPTKSSTTPNEGVERFWITEPFKEEVLAGILNIEELLDESKNPDLQQQLDYWEKNPFKPHAVARLRLSAYMRSTLLKYIDNLIAWGDNLFQRDTIESINEATLLYILAGNILGKKPEKMPARAIPAEVAFSQIQGLLDPFSDAKVLIQSYISPSDSNDTLSDQSVLMPLFSIPNSDHSVSMPLFSIPKNDQLLGYWDTVYDRLFKIRHCMNIEGVFQQLPLFEPPIDPGLLVRATAMGLDLNSIMNDLSISLPNYRFQFMLQKAYELCNDVKGLGSELLSALEKGDAEQLALIRSGQEIKMLDLIRDMKVGQRDEAKQNLESLNKSRDVVQARKDYYKSRDIINASEALYLAAVPTAMVFQNMQMDAQLLSSIGFALPQVTIGPLSSGAAYGGENIGKALQSAATQFGQAANLFTMIGNVANTLGSYQRRKDDWDFQTNSAELELKQIEKQITAAMIRVEVAERDLESHDQQMQNAKEVDDYLRSKFTDADLYDYMVGQVASVYFQSYQLAYNTAKKAEKCLQHELGIEDTSFIQFGYWDSLKKGLLSGEKLQYDLRRLENAYLEQNKREYELTKHISLTQLNPVALLQLKETGSCDLYLPEAIFDLDYPGHYFRRIKSVSLSIPCIAGPYTCVNCTLTLNGSSIRKNSTLLNSEPKYTRTSIDDARFNEQIIPNQFIATSHAQNDSGMFELNFRDERYLPFEGSGAISKWKIELNGKYKKGDANIIDLSLFDFNSISDIILHMKYTAREGGTELKGQVVSELMDALNILIKDINDNQGLFTAIDVRHEFADEWHRFISGGGIGNTIELKLPVSKDRLPFFVAAKNIEVTEGQLFAKKKNTEDKSDIPFNTDSKMTYKDNYKLFTGSASITLEGNDFTFSLQMNKTEVAKLDEMFLVLKYTLT